MLTQGSRKWRSIGALDIQTMYFPSCSTCGEADGVYLVTPLAVSAKFGICIARCLLDLCFKKAVYGLNIAPNILMQTRSNALANDPVKSHGQDAICVSCKSVKPCGSSYKHGDHRVLSHRCCQCTHCGINEIGVGRYENDQRALAIHFSESL